MFDEFTVDNTTQCLTSCRSSCSTSVNYHSVNYLDIRRAIRGWTNKPIIKSSKQHAGFLFEDNHNHQRQGDCFKGNTICNDGAHLQRIHSAQSFASKYFYSFAGDPIFTFNNGCAPAHMRSLAVPVIVTVNSINGGVNESSGCLCNDTQFMQANSFLICVIMQLQ